MRTGLYQSLIGIFSLLIVTNICYGAGTAAVSVSAIVLSKGNCTFNSSNVALSFGSLDPGDPTDQNRPATLTFTCRGNGNNAITFSITHDSGLYETGPDAPQMRTTTPTGGYEYLPYSLTLSPTSGSIPKNTDTSLAISGRVMGVDYQDAYPGNYSDTVTISINP